MLRRKFAFDFIVISIFVINIMTISVQAAPAYTPPAGYTSQACYESASGTLDSFDFDSAGNLYLFRNSTIVKRTPGGDETTLYTFSSSGIYGSFLKVKDSTVYFGESSTGAIKSVSVTGGTANDITSLGYNYDLAFNNSGQAFVVANPGGAGPNTKIYSLDVTSGATDEIADVNNWSGPLAFDTSDSLYYGRGSDIITFTSAQVNSAFGAGVLDSDDWSVLASGLDPVSYFAFDSENDLFSSSYMGSVTQVDTLGSDSAFGTGTSPSFLRFVPGIGSFETGNPAGGHLYVSTTDWGSYTSTIFAVTPVPEPLTLILMASGIFSLLRFTKRTK